MFEHHQTDPASAMPIIYIDADACPVKEEVYRVARRYEMRVVVVARTFMRTPTDPLIEFVERDGFGVVDDWIAEQAGLGDIVITPAQSAPRHRQGSVSNQRLRTN
jgi:uncharacterized protein YaiI (UPF0178 family)